MGKPVQRRSEARQLRVPQDSGSLARNGQPANNRDVKLCAAAILVTANHFNSDIRLGNASSAPRRGLRLH